MTTEQNDDILNVLKAVIWVYDNQWQPNLGMSQHELQGQTQTPTTFSNNNNTFSLHLMLQGRTNPLESYYQSRIQMFYTQCMQNIF